MYQLKGYIWCILLLDMPYDTGVKTTGQGIDWKSSHKWDYRSLYLNFQGQQGAARLTRNRWIPVICEFEPHLRLLFLL
mgnify:FL=1